ncbi:DoxX family membrane protein [candidate division KSB1 bacterium]|nr:DoxX family membrane protein [candidate division KSB1 bacterium]
MKPFINKVVDSKTLFICFRLFLGFIFIYASIGKIQNPALFAEVIENYKILPYSLINLFALLLPWLEFICGLLLILGLCVRGSSLILLGLLCIFTIAIAINVIRGVDITCGCKTPWEKMDRISFQKLAEEIGFILLALQVFFHRSCFLTVDKFFNKS